MFTWLFRLGNSTLVRQVMLICSVVFPTISLPSAALGQDAPPPPTVKEIYEMASKRNGLIKSLSMEAVVQFREFPVVAGRKVAPPMTFRETFAFLGDQRLSRADTVPGPGGKPDQRPRTHIFNGKTTFMLDPGFVLISDKKEPQCDHESYCCTFLGLAHTDEEKAKQQINGSYPQCINPAPTFPLWAPPYKVLPKMELVDGQPCHVVELAGRDRLWVDPKLGGALRQRIRFASDGTNQPPFKAFHYVLGDYTEAAPGIWVPKKAALSSFSPVNKAGKRESQLAHETRVQLESIKINQIDAQFFNREVAPKTILVKKEGSIVVEGPKPIRLNDIDPNFKPK